MSIKQSIRRFFARKAPEPIFNDLIIPDGTVNIFGIPCQVKDGLISLTDLWKISGGNPNRHPQKWVRQEHTAHVIENIKKELKLDSESSLKTVRGHGGGTYGHWQVAMEYAKYLSPKLGIHVNDIFRRYKEGDLEFVDSVISNVKNIEDLKWIEARVRNKQSNVGLNVAIADCEGKAKTCAFVANNNNVAITGKTAKELRKEHNLPDKASTRPFLETDQMIDMAFLERLERKSLEKIRPKGHDAILTICDCAIGTVKEALARHI